MLAAAAPALVAQRVARDPAPATAAGTIAGTVVTTDTIPRPVRRAIVTLRGGSDIERGVVTTDDGRFTVAGLLPGSYTVTVTKPAFVATTYGATTAGGRGTPIALGRGERADITIPLQRGAVLEGRITDPTGDPLAGVLVYARAVRAGVPASRTTASTRADDRGRYRMFGLPPGEYVISSTRSTYTMAHPSVTDIDARLAALAARHQMPPSAPTRTSSPASADEPIVLFAPVYYPGVPSVDAAVRIAVGPGEERVGLDYRHDPVLAATIDGQVTGPFADFSNVQVMVDFAGDGTTPVGSSTTTSPSADGRFVFRGLPPARYTLAARAKAAPPDPAEGPAAGGLSITTVRPAAEEAARTAGEEYLYAVAELDVRGGASNAVTLTLQPGSTITGRGALDAGAAPPEPEALGALVVRALPVQRTAGASSRFVFSGGFTMQRQGQVRADGTFAVTSIAPGAYTIEVVLPAALTRAGWWARSAAWNGRDLLDGSVEFAPGIGARDVLITLSDRRTRLSGSLRLASGLPSPEFSIVAYSTDRRFWSATARRTQITRPASDGRYEIEGLPPGEYFVAVVTEIDPDELMTPAFFERLVPGAIRIQLGDGESRVQDLRLAGR
jgi:hypothetical protein